jgi:hypothetical protein
MRVFLSFFCALFHKGYSPLTLAGISLILIVRGIPAKEKWSAKMSTKKEQKKPQPVTPRSIAVMLMNAGGWYTRRDIAEGLGRKKTSYVVRRIEEATAEGLLLRDYYRQSNGLYCAVYAYNADGDLPL